jgi:hypothetical protein
VTPTGYGVVEIVTSSATQAQVKLTKMLPRIMRFYPMCIRVTRIELCWRDQLVHEVQSARCQGGKSKMVSDLDGGWSCDLSECAGKSSFMIESTVVGAGETCR